MSERTSKKPRKKFEAGVALGGAMAGFEQAVFRTLPPPEEVVRQHRPDEPVPTADGRFLITLPGEHATAERELEPERDDKARPTEG